MSLIASPTRRALTAASIVFATASIAGCGSGTDATASAGTNQTSGQVQGTTPGQGGPGGGGGMRQMDTAALAKTLGVTEKKLTAALAKARPAGGAGPGAGGGNGTPPAGAANGEAPPAGSTPPNGTNGGPPAGGGGGFDRTAMYASIAKELGLTEAKVQKAFEAAMPQRSQSGATQSSGSTTTGQGA